MKRIGVLIPVLAVIFIALVMAMGGVVDYKIDNATSRYKDNIGKSIVLDSDTLTVVNYSLLYEEYTLSDGRNVSYDFVCSTLICKSK